MIDSCAHQAKINEQIESQDGSESGVTKFNYDEIRPGYYDSVYHKKCGIQSRWHHHKFETLARFMPNQGRHLDIGCGPGTFIGSLSSSHDLVSIGIDFSQQQIDYASKTYQSKKADFKCIDLFDPSFDDKIGGEFDIITFVEVIEHIRKKEAIKMLTAARRKLSKDGKLLVTSPNYHSGWGILEKAVNKLGEVTYEDQHINKYTHQRLEHDLKESGFSSISVCSFLSMSPFFASLDWRLSKRIARQELYGGPFRPLGFLLIAEAK